MNKIFAIRTCLLKIIVFIKEVYTSQSIYVIELVKKKLNISCKNCYKFYNISFCKVVI